MIFNFGPWETKRLPVLDENFPTDVKTTIGKAATFTVVFSEEGKPDVYTYQWYVNGKAVEGATAASYTRTASVIGTESIYCVITNKAGSVQSRNASLSIEPEYIVVNGNPISGGFGYYTKDPDSIVRHDADGLFILGDGGGSTRAWTTEKFDFTGKNKLVFYCSGFGRVSETQYGTFYFGAADTQNDDVFIAYSAIPAQNTGDAWVVVDVSQLNGMHYIKIALIRYAHNQDWVKIKNVYFE